MRQADVVRGAVLFRLFRRAAPAVEPGFGIVHATRAGVLRSGRALGGDFVGVFAIGAEDVLDQPFPQQVHQRHPDTGRTLVDAGAKPFDLGDEATMGFFVSGRAAIAVLIEELFSSKAK